MQVNHPTAPVIQTGDYATINIHPPTGEAVLPILPRPLPFLRNPFFTGRKELLSQLHQQLSDTGSAVLSQVIAGLGGVGKTQTALEYAYRFSVDRPVYRLVFWVRADTDLNLASDFAEIARHVGVATAETKLDEAAEAAKRWLHNPKNQDWLLILDNADTPELLEPYRVENPKGRVLITSRARIFDNLGIVNPLKMESLPISEAVEFLLRRTVKVRESLSATELEAVEALAKELGGLPLALEQAGAFIRNQEVSFSDYLASYNLALLEAQPPVVGNYPASVRTTWAMNLRVVAEQEPATTELLQLSAFLASDNIPYFLLIDAAQQWGGQIQVALAGVANPKLALARILTPLANYSLIQQDSVSELYSLHRMLQAVVRDGMGVEIQGQWVERAVQGLNAAFPDPEFQNWKICGLLLPHVQILIQHLELNPCELESLAQLLNKAGAYLHYQGRYSDAEPLYLRSQAIREQQLGADHPDVGISLWNIAVLYYNMERQSEAKPLITRAVQILENKLGIQHPHAISARQWLEVICEI